MRPTLLILAIGFLIMDEFFTYAVADFDKQLHLADHIGDLDWQFDMASGLLSFGDRYRWHAQVLGTESDSSGTWLWAWANNASNIPEDLIQASLTMRTFGEQRGIAELVSSQVLLEGIDGHTLAMIASGVCRSNAYYRAPYDGGAAYLLIMDDSFPRNTDEPLSRIATVFPQAIAALEVSNHRLALLSYLASYGILGRTEGSTVIVDDSDKPAMRATFDEQNRLIHLEANLTGRVIPKPRR